MSLNRYKAMQVLEILSTQSEVDQVEAKTQFNLTTFMKKFSFIDTLAQNEYFIKNIDYLQATIKTGEQIKAILKCLCDFNYALITRFDSVWLRNLENFNNLSFLAEYLNILPVKHWKLFLAHLGHGWFQALFNDMHNLPQASGARLGIFLDKIAKYKHNVKTGIHTMFNAREELDEETLMRWQNFIACLNPDWQEKMVGNPIELNALLNQLDMANNLKKTKKIALFLDHYLIKEKFSNLKSLIFVLEPPVKNETREVRTLSKAKSLQLIQTFNAMQAYKIILRGKEFNAVLSHIDQYQDKPFYRALLLLLTRAWHYQREKNQATFTSAWEKMRGYTRKIKLDLANYLMDCILHDKMIELFPGMTEGQLGQISRRHMESFDSTIIDFYRGNYAH